MYAAQNRTTSVKTVVYKVLAGNGNHFPHRDNDMIFRILDLLSNSHAAVVNGRAFEFEPSRIAITSEHFIDDCLHASCSILCGIHSADETQSGRNSCPEFAFLAFSLDSIMSLSR